MGKFLFSLGLFIVTSTASAQTLPTTYKCSTADYVAQSQFNGTGTDETLNQMNFTLVVNSDHVIVMRQNPGQEPFPEKFDTSATEDDRIVAEGRSPFGAKQVLAMARAKEGYTRQLPATILNVSPGSVMSWLLTCSIGE